MGSLFVKILRNLRYDWPLHFMLLLTNWLPDNVVFLKFRGSLASCFFKQCGTNLRLGRNIIIYNPANIVLGNNIYLAANCWLMAGETIEIQDEVVFGPFAVAVSGDHSKVNGSYRWGKPVLSPVRIGAGSWLGAHAVVVGGVAIGKGVLVAANSVVTHNVTDNASVGGVPARPLGSGEIHE